MTKPLVGTAAIAALETEWSPDGGFFWHLRQGQFRLDDFQRVLALVSTIAVEQDLPRRLVSLLWYVPQFMHWQEPRVRQQGGDAIAYAKAIAAMNNEIQRLLGVP
jgi:hypothetical protein